MIGPGDGNVPLYRYYQSKNGWNRSRFPGEFHKCLYFGSFNTAGDQIVQGSGGVIILEIRDVQWRQEWAGVQAGLWAQGRTSTVAVHIDGKIDENSHGKVDLRSLRESLVTLTV